MGTESKESVLSRWSRRKHEADLLEQSEEAGEVRATDLDEGAMPEVEAETDTKPALTDADMPDIETLDEDSDFSGFMSEGVSDELRNLALRKLFKAPVFNIRDGLDEYDEDYTYFEELGDIVTCDMKHHIEMKEKKLREAEEQEAEAQALEAEEGLVEDTEAIEDIEDIEDEMSSPIDETPETVAETEPGSKPQQETDK